uniref:Uncharacterized protein n=1 Tax=Solanum lycopersicum TaxID=4081 RepID=A0A3Q7J5S6_SOLLC
MFIHYSSFKASSDDARETQRRRNRDATAERQINDALLAGLETLETEKERAPLACNDVVLRPSLYFCAAVIYVILWHLASCGPVNTFSTFKGIHKSHVPYGSNVTLVTSEQYSLMYYLKEKLMN